MRNSVSTFVIAGTVCAVALFAYLETQPSTDSMFLKGEKSDLLEKEYAKFMTEYGRSFGTKAEFRFRRDLFVKKYYELEAWNK
jgi:hypothetical protein